MVAKGADLAAFRIREVAAANEVPILPVPSLARAVYYAADVGQEVPAGLYVAVAQVLAYVFQLRQFQADLGDPPRTLGDHHEVDNHENHEYHEANYIVAADDHLAERLDDPSGSIPTGVSVQQHDPGGGDVQREAQQRGDQQNCRESCEFQWAKACLVGSPKPA